jgi:hypothetical protein
MDNPDDMTTEQQKVAQDAPEQPIVSTQSLPALTVPETSTPVLSPTQGSTLDDHHWEFANFEEGYVRCYITLADTKAAWSFTIASGMLAFLFSQNSTQLMLLKPEWSRALILLLAGVILLVLSAFYSFRVVAPRLKSPSGEGIVFFGAVAAQKSAESYVSAVAARDKRALTEARLKHCYDVSRVCSGKYQHLKRAIWLGLPGLALAITYLLFG